MKKLYAPWRHEYVNKHHYQTDKKKPKDSCIFCDQFNQNTDEKFFILKRFKNTAVMMNFYPYNVGHLMVLPLQHEGNLQNLSPEVRAELMEVVSLSIPLLEQAVNAQGFNIGINLGIAGGGGIPQHLHIHILPRWLGDTNFLEAIGNVKILSSDFQKIYTLLKEKFDQVTLLSK